MLNSITLHKDTWKHIDDNCRYVALTTGCALEAKPPRMAKNLLLCHAKTVELYRNKYQPKQSGEIGITLVSLIVYEYDPGLTGRTATGRNR